MKKYIAQRFVALRELKGTKLIGVDLYVRGKRVMVSTAKNGGYGSKYCLEGENVWYPSIKDLIKG